MAISARTRKILWAKSGNRCAICRRELVMEKADKDPEAIVGEECHITSKKPTGPRSYSTMDVEYDLDSYENLILLCRTHHKIIDDQPNEYSVERLRAIKKHHERWVSETLEAPKERSSKSVALLPQIQAGKDLLDILRGAELFSLDNEELHSQVEVDLVGRFLGLIQDHGDLLDELGAGEVVQTQFELNSMIEELEEMGFLVFGGRQPRKMKLGGQVETWTMATVIVVRRANRSIKMIDGSTFLVPSHL